MIFDGIEISQSLTNSLEDDRLVIFAGAGVSMGPPANLPNFETLTKSIAGSQDVSEPYEAALGALAKNEGWNVHREAKRVLERESPKPNDLHRGLASLFDDAESLRIVTTNYDTLLEEACAAVFGERPTVYDAPALPLGSDFRGLVHLHGSLDDRPDRLVLTDADFGRAYLTEGWARRFLVEMFQEFDVLFVGYSYGDVVMKYLARGLPPSSEYNRYAFVDAPESNEKTECDETDWTLLGIEAIEYSPANGHAQLRRVVDDWVADRARGASTVRSRIQQLLGGDSNRSEDDYAEQRTPADRPLPRKHESYLKAKLSTSVGLDAFCQFAEPKWATWLYEQGMLDEILDGAELSYEQRQVRGWLVRSAVRNPDPVLAVLRMYDGRLNSSLADGIGHRLAVDEPDVRCLRAWIPLFINHTDLWRRGSAWARSLFKQCLESEADGLAWLIFEELLQPDIRLSQGPPKLDVHRRNTGRTLHKCFEQLLEHAGPTARTRLWRLLVGAVRRYHRVSRGLQGEEATPVGYVRSTIESNPANGVAFGSLDVVIDDIRDLIDEESDVERKSSWIEELLDSEVPLLERIGLYGLRTLETMSTDEKLRLVMQREWLFDDFRRHEVFRLLHRAYPQAEGDAQENLLEAIDDYQHETGDEWMSDRSRFRILEWLQREAPDDERIQKRLQALEEDYPEFEPQDEPSLRHSLEITEAGGGQQARKSVDEFREMAVDEILAFFREPVQEGRFRQWVRQDDRPNLGEAVSEASELGLELARGLQSESDETFNDLWGAIFRGWDNASVTDELTGEILEFLVDWEPVRGACSTAARFLRELAKNRSEFLFTNYLEESREIATAIWETTKGWRESIDRWYQAAINSASGVLAEFWIFQLDHLNRREEETDVECETVLSELANMNSGDDQKHKLVRPILGCDLDFLIYMDREWVNAQIVPNLRAESGAGVDRPTWHGVARCSRVSQDLFAMCGDEYRRIVSVLAEMPDGVRRGLLHQCALLVVHFAGEPLNEWIFPILEQHKDDDRAYFIQRLSAVVRELEPEHQKTAWDNWLRELWESRESNVPVELEEKELAEFLNVCIECPILFPRLVERLEDWEGPVDVSALRLFGIERGDDCIGYTSEAARFLAGLARIARNQPDEACGPLTYQLQQLAEAGVTGREVRLFRERLIDMGCPGASRIDVADE